MQIEKTAVIGAGTMGSAIAAHMANAGTEVVLLDVVPPNAQDRNILAKQAITQMRNSNASPFTSSEHANHIIPGNLEDNLEMLKDADWIIEAVVEDLDIKHKLYEKLEGIRKEHSIVSSNTSTLPLSELRETQAATLQQDLCITHFFNPPRHMRLLELVADEWNGVIYTEELEDFIENRLGKTIVIAKDTPGFIANRIGIFWIMQGLEQAISQDIPIEVADALLGKLGFPKTGIFGLFDMIGIDVMLDIVKSLQERLPENDPYKNFDTSIAFLHEMIEKDLTGNKEKKGFYQEGNEKKVYDLQSKYYRTKTVPDKEIIDQIKKHGVAGTFESNTKESRYVWSVISETLRYTASLIPEIADDIVSIDTALRLGYNWEQGPFEMIDALGNKKVSGAEWFASALQKENKDVPEILQQAAEKQSFYKEEKGDRCYLTTIGRYQPVEMPEDSWQLQNKKRGKSPIIENESAKLWDIGNSIACLEFTTKSGIMDNATFDLIEEAVDRITSEFQGLVIGHDGKHFSTGLNLHKILEWCDKEDWESIEALLKRGQHTMLSLKYAPFPVVGAPSGRALGGACEILLHCDYIQAHIETYIGLVETRIGLIPSWGGCKEMLIRHVGNAIDPGSQIQAAEHVFNCISNAKISNSAEEAYDMHVLHEGCGITMNRDKLLHDAKELCLQHAGKYLPPDRGFIHIPKGALKKVFEKDLKQRHDINNHEKHVLQLLAGVLSGGGTTPELVRQLELEAIDDRKDDSDIPIAISESELLNLERKAFMVLIKSKETQRKIKAVL